MKIEHNGKTFHFRETMPKPRKVKHYSKAKGFYIQTDLDEGAKSRFVCDEIKHSAKGEPIRFKSLGSAFRHINNMNL